jgi:ribosome biogenesis GTPase
LKALAVNLEEDILKNNQNNNMAKQSKTLKGRVIKAVASKFFVDTIEGVKICFARKKLKLNGDIYVGDYVEIEKDRDAYVIEMVEKRKNQLIRPYVSNVDVCLIVVAPEPAPDLLLVDKVIVNCLVEGIEPIIVANKCDLAPIDLAEYESVVKGFEVSAENGTGIIELFDYVKGKTICLAGQSAVGKSSLINAILDNDECEVGELARKIKRGKNTTRRIEIYNLGGTYLMDTCGFSMLEAVDIEPESLRLYFDDLEVYRRECKFNTCTHRDEPDCAVKPHVGQEIGQGRYERYKLIYDELAERRKNKYE